MGTESEVRTYISGLPLPLFFLYSCNESEIIGDSTSFEKWGATEHHYFDSYDGVMEWATYGWARVDAFSDESELFRLNINNDPYGDVEYLGDRSLVVFV